MLQITQAIDENHIPQANELLTLAEVADYLRLSRRTAWRWCKSGQLPAKKAGRQWRIAKNDLIEFLNQHASTAVLDPQRMSK